MVYGFKFNDKHCSEYGIIMRSKNRQLLPAGNDQYKEIPGMDGSYLFPDTLRDRYIDINCAVFETSLFALRQKARQIAAWLYAPARAKLIFDDEPGVFYWAKLANQMDLQQTLALGEFSLQFRCLPYAYSVSPIVAEQELASGESIALANSGMANTPVMFEITNPSATGFAAFPALGAGVCPDVSMTLLNQGATLTINGDACSYLGLIDAGKKVYVDTGRMTVQLDGTNALRYHDGAFPVLAPGNNTVVYTSPNGCRAKVKITYTERWL